MATKTGFRVPTMKTTRTQKAHKGSNTAKSVSSMNAISKAFQSPDNDLDDVGQNPMQALKNKGAPKTKKTDTMRGVGKAKGASQKSTTMKPGNRKTEY